MFSVKPRTDKLLQRNAARIPNEQHPSLYAHKALAAFFDTLENRTFVSSEEVARCFGTEWPKFAKGQEGYESFSTFDSGFWLRLMVMDGRVIRTVDEGMGGYFWCGNVVDTN